MWKSKEPEHKKEGYGAQIVAEKKELVVSTFEERKIMETRVEPKPIPVKEGIINIGKSVSIKGELTGDEDLTIEGRVEGKVELKDHNLVIGPHGEITAEINAKNVTINGKVTGNVFAGELVEIKESGSLAGNIESSRISIADGAHFKGSVNLRKGVDTGEKPLSTVSKPAKMNSDHSVLAELQAV